MTYHRNNKSKQMKTKAMCTFVVIPTRINQNSKTKAPFQNFMHVKHIVSRTNLYKYGV